jgi:hypothetical protein
METRSAVHVGDGGEVELVEDEGIVNRDGPPTTALIDSVSVGPLLARAGERLRVSDRVDARRQKKHWWQLW